MDIARVVAKLTAPMRRRLALMVGRCVLLTVNDAAGVQELQVRALAGEELDRVERFQEYGFTSRPHPGAEGAMVSVGGLRGHSLVVGVEDKRYRLTGLRSGEVAVHDDQGQIIHLKRDHLRLETPWRVVVSAGQSVFLDTPFMQTSGDLYAGGDIIDRTGAGGASMDAMRQVYDAHNHPENDSGGPTDAPNRLMAELGASSENKLYEAVAQSVKTNPQATDMDLLLVCLPEIADAEAARAAGMEALGWAYLARFLRKWFAGPPSTDKALRPGSMIDWDWLLSYSRVQDAWDEITNPDYLFSDKARVVLAGRLQADGLLTGAGGEFDYTSGEVSALYDRQHQYITVNDRRIDLIYNDSLNAALKAFTFYGLAKGRVEPHGAGWRIVVTGAAVFMRDNFDFEGDNNSLGWWSCDNLKMTLPFWGTEIRNPHFCFLRERYNVGGDFFVYAAPRSVDGFGGLVYDAA